MRVAGWVTVAALLAGSISARADEPLTLEQAIAQALKSNPAIDSSVEAVAAADARIEQAIVGYLPTLLVSAGYKRQTLKSAAPPYLAHIKPPSDPAAAQLLQSLSTVFGNDGDTSYNNYSAGVTLSHPIWDFGKTDGTKRAAKEGKIAAENDLEATRDQIRLNTILSYYLLLAAQETNKVAEETVKQMEQHLALAKAQATAGVRQRIDVTRAQSDLAQAALNLAQARTGIQTSQVNLSTVMGLERPVAFHAERPPAAEVLKGTHEEYVKKAFDRRPEVKALRARSRSVESQIDVADAAYFPNFNLQAGLQWQGYQLDTMPMNWFAGISLQWNALTPIAVSAATKEIVATNRGLIAQQRSLELQIRSDVENAALSYDDALSRRSLAAASVTTASETLRLAEGRYKAGSGNIIEVTDAQSTYTQARLAQIRVEFDIETARARLQRAMGAFDNN